MLIGGLLYLWPRGIVSATSLLITVSYSTDKRVLSIFSYNSTPGSKWAYFLKMSNSSFKAVFLDDSFSHLFHRQLWRIWIWQHVGPPVFLCYKDQASSACSNPSGAWGETQTSSALRILSSFVCMWIIVMDVAYFLFYIMFLVPFYYYYLPIIVLSNQISLCRHEMLSISFTPCCCTILHNLRSSTSYNVVQWNIIS